MAQLVAIPEGGDRPIPLRCAANGVLLVQSTGLENRLSSTDVPPPVPPPPVPILGINPAGELQAVAVDDFGRILIHDEEGKKSLRDSVKKIKGLSSTPAPAPRFHSLALAGEIRTLILKPGATEPSIALDGPAILVHLSVRSNTRGTSLLKLRFKTKSESGELVSDSRRSIDRELGPCESWDLPLQAGVAVEHFLEASAVASQDDSTSKNGISLTLHYVRV